MAFDNQRISAEEARRQLEAAGRYVEEAIGTIYVGTGPEDLRTRIHDNGRGFSQREVTALVSAHADARGQSTSSP